MEGEHKRGVTREKHQRTELRTAGLMEVLDGVGRLTVVPASGQRKHAWDKEGAWVHLAQMFVSLCLRFSRARTSSVNEHIAQKGTAEIL